MRVVYPKEIKDLRDSIPVEYRNHPERAPEEYRVKVELWKKKMSEYDKKMRLELFGF